ncbi:phosphatase PAP2 family protein [Streptomyces sp. LP11]|uniref:Phosphatase PAP2 family protein n=1 Tax=Streptomyces pyxinicus TaxID=2970331 RepID=A0ABT2B585_9ACTN|nr:phosphatase PAP2 family protein [Streptomyces sp. LP11]MCS0603688.1 phosphatase PAP2 family protein [Streptomyces sp. LP11]
MSGPRAVRAWRAVTALGSRPVAYTVVAGRCLLAPPGRGAGARLAPPAVLAVADAVRELTCRAVDRPRPPGAGRRTAVHGASFPSRHTMTALIAWDLASGSRPAAVAVTAAVGASRLALGAHWPTDVLGGWLFGAVGLALADLCGGHRRLRTRDSEANR